MKHAALHEMVHLESDAFEGTLRSRAASLAGAMRHMLCQAVWLFQPSHLTSDCLRGRISGSCSGGIRCRKGVIGAGHGKPSRHWICCSRAVAGSHRMPVVILISAQQPEGRLSRHLRCHRTGLPCIAARCRQQLDPFLTGFPARASICSWGKV